VTRWLSSWRRRWWWDLDVGPHAIATHDDVAEPCGLATCLGSARLIRRDTWRSERFLERRRGTVRARLLLSTPTARARRRRCRPRCRVGATTRDSQENQCQRGHPKETHRRKLPVCRTCERGERVDIVQRAKTKRIAPPRRPRSRERRAGQRELAQRSGGAGPGVGLRKSRSESDLALPAGSQSCLLARGRLVLVGRVAPRRNARAQMLADPPDAYCRSRKISFPAERARIVGASRCRQGTKSRRRRSTRR
jgi:hypothetical protein